MSTKLDQIKKLNVQSALLAVSGGVDSIALLHLLAGSSTQLEVAYIDHSQREDTNQDIESVKLLTDKFKVKLHVIKLNLPKNCSEQLARSKRYQTLHKIKTERNLEHLITAHHADDVIETAIINLLRGTGPRGLSALRHQPNGIWRPYLFDLQNENYITKQDILDYAHQNDLKWHEDSTNSSGDYLRNRIRSRLKVSNPQDKLSLLRVISKNITLIEQIDQEISKLEQDLKLPNPGQITYSTKLFKSLPEEVKDQFLHTKISQHGYDVNKDAVIRAKEFIQTKTTGKILQLKGCNILIPQKETFTFISVAREKED